MEEFSSTGSKYRESLLYLKEYEDYDYVYRNYGTFYSGKELLDNVIECCDLILTGRDDHESIKLHGYQLYAAKALSGLHRTDGNEGNIFYAIEKAK